jgi:8-oxo-dGTP diphosphatase
VGALILDEDRILLVERSRPPLAGYWSLPGGAVETGERLEDALHREVAEETGLKVRPLAIVEVFERITRDRRGRPLYHYVLIDYLCRAAGGRLAAGDDAGRARWFRRRELSRLRLTEGTLAVIRKAFRMR